MSDTKGLREKVNGFLRAALVETDDVTRTSLIGKATYWHQVAVRQAQKLIFDPKARA